MIVLALAAYVMFVVAMAAIAAMQSLGVEFGEFAAPLTPGVGSLVGVVVAALALRGLLQPER